jgi:hypothetical protein
MEAMSGRYSTGSSTYRKSISPKKQSYIGSGESYEVLGNGEIDFNLLDYKQPTDFIQKCLSFQNERSLLEQMASQLKVSRSLLKLSTILTNDATNNSETIHNIIDCAQVFLDAEKIVFAPIDPAMNLVITPLVLATQHSAEVLRVSSGIECMFFLSVFFFLSFESDLDDTLQSRRGGIIINEVMNDTRVNLDIYRSLNVIPRNLICYPVIHSNSSPMGLLLVINKLSVNSTFTSSDLWCLEYISSYIATAHLLNQQQHQSPPTVAADKNQHFPISDNLSLSQTQQQPELALPQQHQPSFVSNFSSAAAPVAFSSSSLSKSTSPKSQQMSTIELCIEQLINNAYHILRADKISLFLPHENSHQLICTISRDIKGMQVSMDEGVVGQTLKSKSPIHSSNVRENIHHSNSMDTLTGYQTVSLLSYPILAKNGTQVLGVLQAINKEGADDFSAEDNHYFSNLSTYISELLSNKGDDHVESMNLNIIKAIGDYSYSSAYSYRTHIYDHLADFNENRVLELISYCKLICSTNHVLMYALQHSSGASTSVPLTTQFENEIMAESANVGLELKYLSSLSAQEDSSSIANPSSGDYGSVYSMPSYRNKSIPSSVLRAIQQNRIIQITRRAHTHMTPPPQESQGQGPARGQQEESESDENYLQSVNSTAAIIIPLHLAASASASSLSFSGQASESPLDVLIILKTITSPSSLSSSPAHPTPVPSKDTLPSFSYLFNLSLNDFTTYQSHGIHCLLKIFRCTYQLSLTHREELFQQSILENKVQIMNDSLVQLDTMYCLLSGEGLLKLYNPSFEEFLGVPQTTLDSLSKSNDNSSLSQSYPSSGVDPSRDEEYKLMDLSLDSLLPSPSSALVQSLHEAIRSGNMTRGQDVLLKTFRHPMGVRVNYEIYEYYGHHSATSASAVAPVSTKKRVRKSLTRLDSFHFDNSSSPLQERRFTGRTGKLYRICLKYSNNIEQQQDKEQQQQLQQEVIQSNSRLINEFPSVACGDDSNCNLAILLDQSEEIDSFVLQTKNSLLPSTPQKRSSHGGGGSPMTTPRSPRGSGGGGFLSPSSSSKLSQLSLLYSWDFNSLEVPSADHQKQYALLLLEKNVNITELNIPKAFFYSLISDIESNYYANPFHNFQHALCVLQFLFMLLENTNFPAPAAAASASRVSLLPQLSDRKKRRSNPREKKIDQVQEQGQGEGQGNSCSYHHLIPHDHLYLTVLLSALFHDLRHPGNTNLFEINSHSSKALLYNDQSVLENYHCSTAFHLLNLPKNNIFLHYSFADKALIRKLIISCVLATDMSQHNHLIQQIQDRTRTYSSEISRGDYVSIMKTRDEEMIFYGKILLHCADLSNPVRPFPISKQWAELVSEEFNEQGKKESFLQLPVSSFLLSPTLEALVKNEIFFSNEVVLPLWKSMELYFPTVPKFRAFVQQIHENTALWKLLVNDNTSSATAPSASLSASASASVSLSSPAHSSANASSES